MWKILLRGATRQKALQINPILGMNELFVEEDTRKMKIGDGVKRYSELGYIVATPDTPPVNIEDSLNSSSKTSALSANQGRILNQNKVDNSRVLTDVPAGAKFTDTIVQVVNNPTGDGGDHNRALSAEYGWLLRASKADCVVGKNSRTISGHIVLSADASKISIITKPINAMGTHIPYDAWILDLNENNNPFMGYAEYRKLTAGEAPSVVDLYMEIPGGMSEVLRYTLSDDGHNYSAYEISASMVVNDSKSDGDVYIAVMELPIGEDLSTEVILALLKLKYGFTIDCKQN